MTPADSAKKEEVRFGITSEANMPTRLAGGFSAYGTASYDYFCHCEPKP
ncbi:MAG: hypothetical protein V3W00_08030 [Candidatus Brocadiales bacterium]